MGVNLDPRRGLARRAVVTVQGAQTLCSDAIAFWHQLMTYSSRQGSIRAKRRLLCGTQR
jgi:hypothetical protein